MQRLPCSETWSAQALASQLTAMGIRAGETLIVHASFKSIGNLDGGAQTVIDALAETIGEQGTLLMPVFSDPQPDGIFRTLSTPSRVGYLTEFFRTMAGVRRSLHPTHSVAAKGPLGDALLAGHESMSGLSNDSPLHRAAQHAAKVLMIGCDMTSCSAVHIAESIERVPYLGRVWYDGYDRTLRVETDDGRTLVVEPKDPPTCSDAFDRVGERMDNLLRHVQFGDAPSLLFNAADAIDTARRMLRENPHALLCDHPRCPVCTAARGL